MKKPNKKMTSKQLEKFTENLYKRRQKDRQPPPRNKNKEVMTK